MGTGVTSMPGAGGRQHERYDARSAGQSLVPVAEAAHRAGVHPNVVRRLIDRGEVRGTLLKDGGSDTWLVDAEVVLARLAPPAPVSTRPTEESSETPPHGDVVAPTLPGPADGAIGDTRVSGVPPPAPGSEPLASIVDLSMDRAQAIERYTHSLLRPLVELLREREAAIERREAIVRRQATRIGRLEREVELLRVQLAQVPPAAAGPSATSAAPPAPEPPETVEPEAAEEDEQPDPGHVGAPVVESPILTPPKPTDEGTTEGATESEAFEEAVTLSRQMQQVKSELHRIATRLEEPTMDVASFLNAPPDSPPPGEPAGDAGAAETPAAPAPRPAAPVEVEAASAEPDGAARSTPLASAAPRDPFAEAEAAIQALQQALAARRGQPEVTPNEHVPSRAVQPAAGEVGVAPATATAEVPSAEVVAPPAALAAAEVVREPVVSPAEREALEAMQTLQDAQRRDQRRPWWRFW